MEYEDLHMCVCDLQCQLSRFCPSSSVGPRLSYVIAGTRPVYLLDLGCDLWRTTVQKVSLERPGLCLLDSYPSPAAWP